MEGKENSNIEFRFRRAEVLACYPGLKSALEVFLYYYLSAHEIFKKANFFVKSDYYESSKKSVS